LPAPCILVNRRFMAGLSGPQHHARGDADHLWLRHDFRQADANHAHRQYPGRCHHNNSSADGISIIMLKDVPANLVSELKPLK
jgi:hypothetical protein